MKQKYLLGFVIGVLFLTAVFTYARQIMPILIEFPFRQDFAQDYLGALALINRGDELYPILGPAFEQINVNWNVLHRSTHPPTAFFLVVPFAFLNYHASQIVWMVAMFSCIVYTAHLLGLTWRKSIFVGLLSLAWPPTIWSLYQFTPIWLLGLVLAYKFRHYPFRSGIFIALASLPKFLAIPSLLYHIRRHKWLALTGFIVFWLGVLGMLLILRPDALSAYLSSNTENSLDQIHRTDNGALLIVAWRLGGWVGLLAAGFIILWVLWSGFRNDSAISWGCLVWLGIAFLPIAWVYSLLPLLPWLLLVLRTPSISARLLVFLSILLPYASAVPGKSPTIVALCIVLSGIALATASEMETQKMSMSDQ